MPAKDIRPITRYVDEQLANLNAYTNRWAPHLIIFGSLCVFLSTPAHRFFRIQHETRWATRRTIAAWCSLGAVVSYCSFEGNRFRMAIKEDPELWRMYELRRRAETREWQKVPMSLQVDHLLPLIGNEDVPLKFCERMALFMSRTFASDASRAKYTALLRPEVEAGRLSTQDYDLCITALANKADRFAFMWHCAASLGTVSGLSLLLLAIPQTRGAARKLPFARMFSPSTIAMSAATYHDARAVTEFQDRQHVIKVLEKLFPTENPAPAPCSVFPKDES